MQVNASLLVSVLIGTIALAPRPAPSADVDPARGAWGGVVVTERRSPADLPDATWQVGVSRSRVDSRVEHRAAVHRVVSAWTALADALTPGEAIPLSASAMLVEAGTGAECSVEVVAWQGDPSERDGAPRMPVRLVGTTLPAGEPAGAVAQAVGAWRVPAPDRAPGRTLHVRATVTHRGNVVMLTRSYAWMPAGPQSAD